MYLRVECHLRKTKMIKNIIYFYSNLNGKANRIEYGIYLFFDIIANLTVLHLNENMNFKDETIINLFYIWIILNFIFVPIQAVSTRRLKDIGINRGILFLNFIPILNIFFRAFLLFKKGNRTIQNESINRK
jgi:uncharacterized membrane protein YhaH (DUF805 family)